MSELWERTPRRQRCLRRIAGNGERQLWELVWNASKGMDLDQALELLAAFSAADCRAAAVAELPIGRPRVVAAGRH
jgi:hypothetical protein